MAEQRSPVSKEDFNDFNQLLIRLTKERKGKEKKLDEEHNAKRELLEKTFHRVDRLIQRHIGKSTSGVGQASGRGSNPPIGLIKSLLGKLKSLIPQRLFGGPLRSLLDKALDNLSPNDEWEFQRLKSFIDEVYKPSLSVLLEGWHLEMKAEVYEDDCRQMLDYLLDAELKKQGE